jgi:hypothetical protein
MGMVRKKRNEKRNASFFASLGKAESWPCQDWLKADMMRAKIDLQMNNIKALSVLLFFSLSTD